MSFDGADKQWKCGAGGAVNLQKVGSIVRDIGEPCLYQSPIKVVIAISKMLKPDKWQAAFDSDGKLFGFQKMLKSIILGGVDPSIRAEVWEFLLGCYDLSSTTESRKQLRTARRERYSDLIKQCQMMHSSIGTGSLAYVVGSKVMDMRLSSKDDDNGDAEGPSGRNSESNTKKVDGSRVSGSKRVNKPSMIRKKRACDSGDLESVRGSIAGGAYDSPGLRPSLDPYKCSSSTEHGTNESCYAPESYMDFPALLVTDLFEKNDNDREGPKFDEDECSTRSELSYGEDHMHSFQITNNADLVVESNSSPSNEALLNNSKCEIAHSDVDDSLSRPSNLKLEKGMVNSLRISDAPEIPGTFGQGGSPRGDRVSEWLWMLHRIVVDVVRTDSHLEFYEDSKNLARMSDILAVYAWVDPETGYCQGMSDLLSPFVVLFEDDADAFWCFEMLIRRMRANFKMEGPTGVMKQLQALWHILELTDKEMFSHLSHIGAESLHFAFRMLLVLFRRELTFNEALRMWEMIWAADFDVSLTCLLDENCPEILAIQLPGELEIESGEESIHSSNGGGQKGSSPSKHGTIISDNQEIKSGSNRPFCGLTKTFWSRNDQLQVPTIISSTGNGDDELPVFCVAAILIMNRQKILRETHSIDDLIKIFNDNVLEIRVKRCIRSAIKLRKKYFYKLIKNRNLAAPSVNA